MGALGLTARARRPTVGGSPAWRSRTRGQCSHSSRALCWFAVAAGRAVSQFCIDRAASRVALAGAGFGSRGGVEPSHFCLSASVCLSLLITYVVAARRLRAIPGAP